MGWTRFFRRTLWDTERAREIEAHLAIEADDQIARGVPPQQARAAAMRKFGNPTLVREEIYMMNTIGWLDTLWQDVRYAARVLGANRGFTAVALLSLALGIGANSTMFELVNVVRLRTLPVADPGSLAEVRIAPPRNRTGSFNGRRPEFTFAQWEELRSRQQAFSGLFAWSPMHFNLTRSGEVRLVDGMFVSGETFEVLGVRPHAGRLLTAADDRPGCESPGVVISHGFWQREHGGRPVIGETMLVDGRRFEIAGITPPGFFGLEVGRAFAVALPLCAEPLLTADQSRTPRRDAWWLGVMGRLHPNTTREQAAAQLRAISPAIFEATLPPSYTAQVVKEYTALELTAEDGSGGISMLRTQYETSLLLLLGITAVVLLIACANLANLMLARATAREREMAVRLAIGASRSRLVRQLLTESLLLAATGAAAGALLARWLSRLLVAFITTDRNPVFLDLAIDWRTLAFTAGVGIATCLLFGLVPAVRVTRTPPAEAMKAGGRGTTTDSGRFGLRRVLVGGQVALTLVLLVGALLLGRSLQNLMDVDTGFREEGIITAEVDLHGDRPAGRPALVRQLLERLRHTPGVDAAAFTSIVPLSGSASNNLVEANDVAVQPQDRLVHFHRVSEGFFSLMEMPPIRGRAIDSRDTIGAPRAAVVNETFARRFFGGADPIGRTFREAADAGQPEPVYEIVGLVRDSKYRALREEQQPIVYLSLLQERELRGLPSYLIRSARPPASLVPELTLAIRDVHPEITVMFDVLEKRVHNLSLRERLIAMLSAGFGVLAVVLSTVGVYGVMSYIVARRRNEIGVRIALGASRRSISQMIVSELAVVLMVGLAAGTGLAILAARTASTLLFGLAPYDPATLGTAVATLAAIGLLAGYLPARRAARLEPLSALREE